MNRLKILAYLVILVAFAWFVWNQQAKISDLTQEVSEARQALSQRVMAEDKEVIEAFELGRTQAAQRLQKQKEVLDALESQNRAAAGALSDARDRVRRELADTAGGEGGSDLPSADAQTCESFDAYRSRVLEAARILADGVLAVGADADEAARTFNALIEVDQSEGAP